MFKTSIVKRFVPWTLIGCAVVVDGYAAKWPAIHLLDIVLTAALLAGGADPIYRLMDTFRKFLEASSAKASGTTK